MNLVELIHVGNFKKVKVVALNGNLEVRLTFNSTPSLIARLLINTLTQQCVVEYYLSKTLLSKQALNYTDAVHEDVYHTVADYTYSQRNVQVSRKSNEITELMSFTAMVLSYLQVNTFFELTASSGVVALKANNKEVQAKITKNGITIGYDTGLNKNVATQLVINKIYNPVY